MCTPMEFALRRHTESCDASNSRNFIEILAAHDSVVQKRLQNGPRNAVYISPEIENSFLHIMGEIVKEKICTEVKNVGVYSTLANETKDGSKTEQMAIVVKYVDVEATIHKGLLIFVEVSSLDAESLMEYIMDTLKRYHVDSIVSHAGL